MRLKINCENREFLCSDSNRLKNDGKTQNGYVFFNPLQIFYKNQYICLVLTFVQNHITKRYARLADRNVRNF